MHTQANAQASEASPWQNLHIKAAGMCCAVGYRLAAAACALRANMDHFQESEYTDSNGKPLVVARLPLGNHWGVSRLAEIARLALQDCLKTEDNFDPSTTALILLAAESGRPHTVIERYHAIWHAIVEQFTVPFHPASVISPHGRAGLGTSLELAQNLLTAGKVTQVLLLGVDSYLDSATIEHFLAQERVQCTDNPHGFIPGEGAGVLLLQLADATSRGLVITGAGVAKEEATLDNSLPNRSIGLTKAMRQACQHAHITPSELDFRMSDQNGEQVFIKESSNACTRLMGDDSVFLPLLHIAAGVGETGAACGPMSLAYLTRLMPRMDGQGKIGLLHFANDNGVRAACIAEYLQ